MKTFKFSLVLRTRENTDVFISLDDNIYGIHSKRINILYVSTLRALWTKALIPANTRCFDGYHDIMTSQWRQNDIVVALYGSTSQKCRLDVMESFLLLWGVITGIKLHIWAGWSGLPISANVPKACFSWWGSFDIKFSSPVYWFHHCRIICRTKVILVFNETCKCPGKITTMVRSPTKALDESLIYSFSAISDDICRLLF